MADNFLEKQYEEFQRKKNSCIKKPHTASCVRLDTITVFVNNIDTASNVLVILLNAEKRDDILYLPTLNVSLRLIQSKTDIVQRLEFVFPSKGSLGIFCETLSRKNVPTVNNDDVIEFAITNELTFVCKTC